MFVKFFNCISMIPYPSGKLHIGHSRNYIINDIYNRFINFLNYKSKMLMSWDSFGTPAENASLINNLNPYKFTIENVKYMKKQFYINNFSINWKKEFKTIDNYYYYFNQILILKFLKYKIIYISNKKINWDPCDKTVLSEEQVIKNKGWRSSCFIKRINIFTYYLKIKKYKKEIFKEILNLDWPSNVKNIQKNWIFSKIFKYNFILKFYNLKNLNYFSISNLMDVFNSILNFNCFFKNVFYIKNNLGVFQFLLIQILKFELILNFNYRKKFFYYLKLKNKILISFKNFNFISFKNINIYFKIKKLIIKIEKWKIKDWGFSRQRYWGFFLPFKFCKFCKNLTNLKSKNLPLLLAKNLKNNRNYYSNILNWKKCFNCNSNWHTFIQDTGDTFFDSSWYFYNYFYKKNTFNYFLPIDLYIGGSEHSTLHLLYLRYFSKILRDLKYLNFGEPIKKFFSQGLILKKLINNCNYEKMSKSKNNVISSEEIINSYCLNSFRLTIIKNSLNNHFIWDSNYNIFSFNFLKKFLKVFKFYRNFKNFKEKFFKNFKINNKIKIYILNINQNFKNCNLNILDFNYNKNIIIIKKLIKKIKILLIINKSLLKIIIINNIKILQIITPLLSNYLWFKLNIFKFLNIKFKFNVFKIVSKFRNYFKIILIKNSKIFGKINVLFFNKKKYFNYIFFKNKILKKTIIKIYKFKNIINFF